MIDSNVVISIVGFVTTISVTVLNQRAAARKSREDRVAKALEIKNQLSLATKLAAFEAAEAFRKQTEELKANAEANRDHIQADLAKNTEISVKAFNEANHVNEKISKLQETILTKEPPPCDEPEGKKDEDVK